MLNDGDEIFWKQFTLVIVSGGFPSEVRELSKTLWELDIPLVVIDSMSFFASLYISVKEHTVIESHPTSLVDLRLDSVWPSLQSFVNSYDLETLDDTDFAHVPYPVLLIKYLELWKAEHGCAPSTPAEKREFKSFISIKRRGPDQENTDEAMSNSWHLFKDSTVSPEVMSIINHERANTITEDVSIDHTV